MTSALELFNRMGSEVKYTPSKVANELQVLVPRELLERVLAQMVFNVKTPSATTAEIAAALSAALRQGIVSAKSE